MTPEERAVALAAAQRVEESARRLRYLVAEGRGREEIHGEAETLRAWLVDVEVMAAEEGS